MARLSPAQRRILEWMSDGDGMLTRQVWDETAYGVFQRSYGGKSRGATIARVIGGLPTYVFHRMCSRRTVDILVERGFVEWMNDSPSDLRAAITIAGREVVAPAEVSR